MKLIEIIKELKVEVSKPNIFQAVVAKQYDMNTRFIKATFVDGTDIISIPHDSTVKAIINAERPDGQAKPFEGVVNEDGTVTVPLHSWMLEMEGSVICDISVIDTQSDDNKKLTTTAFTLLVERASYGGDDVTNDPQYDVLVSLVETCEEASVAAQEALEKSNEANAKYEACVEATENANSAAEEALAVRSEIEKGGFIESVKEANNGNKFSFWVGTSEEYAALTSKENNCLYIVTDDGVEDIVNRLIAVENEVNAIQSKNGVVLFDETISYADSFENPVEISGLADYSLVKVGLGSSISPVWVLCTVYKKNQYISITGTSVTDTSDSSSVQLWSVVLKGECLDKSDLSKVTITKNTSTRILLRGSTDTPEARDVVKIIGVM